jgi:hypothetical protein
MVGTDTMSPRSLYTRLIVGSRLYGYDTAESDLDFLDLVVPTKMELIANKRITIPQSITDTADTRTMLLGEFVMSLGTNPENSLIAMHYQDEFPDPALWLRKQTAFRLIEVAEKMMLQAGKPKMAATAFRYISGAIDLSEDGMLTYPMSDEQVYTMRWLLKDSDEPKNVTYHWENLMAGINESGLSNEDIDYEAMAEWTAQIYLEVHNNGTKERAAQGRDGGTKGA